MYGFGEVVEKGISLGANPKAGMDAEEFEKYLIIRIVSLYPYAEDIERKRVLIMVDSGTGLMNESLLATLRSLWILFLPRIAQLFSCYTSYRSQLRTFQIFVSD